MDWFVHKPMEIYLGVWYLKGHGSSRGWGGGGHTLSCYLSLIFTHSDTKWDTKKKTVDRGRAPVAPPSKSATAASNYTPVSHTHTHTHIPQMLMKGMECTAYQNIVFWVYLPLIILTLDRRALHPPAIFIIYPAFN